jgi:hypothetical protein
MSNLDAWDRASNPTSFGSDFWGQFKVDAWLCALVKGKGKVPYDPAIHDRPATALDLEVIPLPEMNVTNDKITQRNIIAESDEWRSFGWASLKALGMANLKEARDRWCRVSLVPTGETYEKDGKTKERTTFKFVTLFPDEAGCRTDYLANGGNSLPPAVQEVQVAPSNGNGNGPEKLVAFAFAKVIVNNTMKGQVGHPLDEAMNEVGKALAQYPGVSKYFSVQSPEVIELMMTYPLPPF